MEGVFGFIFGVIPETIHYGLQRLSATITAVFHTSIANTCEVIRGFYGSPTTSSDGGTEHAAPTRGSRFERPQTSAMPAAPAAKDIDYFNVLGLRRKDYTADTVKKAYRQKALVCHPDKARTPKDANQWEHVEKAYKLLQYPDSLAAQNYLASYDGHFFKPAASQKTGQGNQHTQARSRFVRPK
jgi:hypothetical protein